MTVVPFHAAAVLTGPTGTYSSKADVSDLRLEVNTTTGDVSVLATTAVAFTGYNIVEPSNNLQDSGNQTAGYPPNELLLSVAASAGGNTTQYRSSTNYQLYAVVEDDEGGLSEAQNKPKYRAGMTATYDTINIPAGGTIDFGNIYDTASNPQDLSLQFSEANAADGNPVTGITYSDAPVDYVSSPEPASLSLVAFGAVGLLHRRRRPTF